MKYAEVIAPVLTIKDETPKDSAQPKKFMTPAAKAAITLSVQATGDILRRFG